MQRIGAGPLLAVASLAAGLWAGPAAAATYKFTPIGTVPDGLPVEAHIGFADGASPVSGTKMGAGFAGITSFLFRVGSFEADLDDLLAIQASCASPDTFPCLGSVLDYDLGPKAGSIYYNDTASDFLFQYDGPEAFGFINSDGFGPEACQTSEVCSFRGSWTAVAEPASLAVLLAALGLSAGVRRRRG